MGRVRVVLPRKQPAFSQHFFAEFALQPVAQQEARVGSKADAELANDVFVETASREILTRPCTLRPEQTILKKNAGALVDLEQRGPQPRIFRFCLSAEGLLGHGYAQLLRDRSDGLRKGNVFDFLNEAEDIPRCLTPKTVIKLPCSVHRKGR